MLRSGVCVFEGWFLVLLIQGKKQKARWYAHFQLKYGLQKTKTGLTENTKMGGLPIKKIKNKDSNLSVCLQEAVKLTGQFSKSKG